MVLVTHCIFTSAKQSYKALGIHHSVHLCTSRLLTMLQMDVHEV